MCGEETALLASIEGKRGMPRVRPPYPAQSGLSGQPTCINNVETFANVAAIVEHGADWFASVGTQRSKGTKVFALTGNIKLGGLVEVPMGMTLRDVVFTVGGGILHDRPFKAVQIGGPSGGCLPTALLDTPIDYDNLIAAGAMMGSGGLVVMDEQTCMVDLARFFMEFIRNESCGKCIPCREGTTRMLEILERIVRPYRDEDAEATIQRFKSVIMLEELAQVIKDTSLCGLGQTAPNPVLATLRYFREEYEAHVFQRHCPAGACRSLLTFTIDGDKCEGCTLCVRNCPANCITGSVKQPHLINIEQCLRCGRLPNGDMPFQRGNRSDRSLKGEKKMADTITLTINDKPVKAHVRANAVAGLPGAWHRYTDAVLSGKPFPSGACRMCVVEVDGARGLVPSCAFPAAEGQVVHTHSPRARRARKTIVELLLANHPQECLTCVRSGKCELQMLAQDLGIREQRYEGLRRAYPVDASSVSLERDPEKCILCGPLRARVRRSPGSVGDRFHPARLSDGHHAGV